MPINRKFLFDRSRGDLFDGRLKQAQVEGIAAILDEWEAAMPEADDRWLAYMLATAHHETGRTMQPIREWGSNRYFFDMYDKDGRRPEVARRLGNTQAGDGVRFCGRGYVQLTGRANYAKYAALLKLDLLGEPDLTMQAPVAVRILFHGMTEGTFTGRKLASYFSPQVEDWRNARRIINGLDKADLVASYGKQYYAAISYTTG